MNIILMKVIFQTGIMPSSTYAEYHLCWVSLMLSITYAQCQYADWHYALSLRRVPFCKTTIILSFIMLSVHTFVVIIPSVVAWSNHLIGCVSPSECFFCVEWLRKYQEVRWIPALQCFISDLEKRRTLCWYDDRCKMFLFYVLEGETFVQNVRLKIVHHAMQ